MRRTAQSSFSISTHSAHSTQIFDAERVVRALEQRVARLERHSRTASAPSIICLKTFQPPSRKSPAPSPSTFKVSSPIVTRWCRCSKPIGPKSNRSAGPRPSPSRCCASSKPSLRRR
jgi:hypothetical protein